MAVLDQLKLTNATPRREASPVEHFRRRLVDAIQLQIELANADLSGRPLNRTRRRWVKDKATGQKELREIPVRLRRWWWKDASGTICVSLRYGAKPLELAPGKSAIEVAGLEELPDKLSLVCEAVRAGELDGCRAKVASFGRVPFTKPKGTVSAQKPPGTKG